MALIVGIRKLFLLLVFWCWINFELYDFFIVDVFMLFSLYRRLMLLYRFFFLLFIVFFLMDLERLIIRNWYLEGRKLCFVRCWLIIFLYWMKVWLLIWKYNEFVFKGVFKRYFFKEIFFFLIFKIILNNFLIFFYFN